MGCTAAWDACPTCDLWSLIHGWIYLCNVELIKKRSQRDHSHGPGTRRQSQFHFTQHGAGTEDASVVASNSDHDSATFLDIPMHRNVCVVALTVKTSHVDQTGGGWPMGSLPDKRPVSDESCEPSFVSLPAKITPLGSWVSEATNPVGLQKEATRVSRRRAVKENSPWRCI